VRILTHFESDYGAAPKVEMHEGQKVTNIIPDFASKRWVGFLGEIAAHPFLPICRSQIDIRFNCSTQQVAQQMPGFHWMMVYGDYRRELGYALKKIPIAWECWGREHHRPSDSRSAAPDWPMTQLARCVVCLCELKERRNREEATRNDLEFCTASPEFPASPEFLSTSVARETPIRTSAGSIGRSVQIDDCPLKRTKAFWLPGKAKCLFLLACAQLPIIARALFGALFGFV
jgi:hypothetical protein